MGSTALTIKTQDGTADCHFFTPAGDGPFPGILFFMDGIGIRPALLEMAERLSSSGYAVLLPNFYYRNGPAEAIDANDIFNGGPGRDKMMAMLSALTNDKAMRDTEAFLGFLDTNPKVRHGKYGSTGYCLGGRLAVAAAGTFPDKFSAVASIHGGGLATDAADSPHLKAGQMTADVYIGVAGIDPWLAPGETDRLEEALVKAGVKHTVEIYPDVNHGFAPHDTPVYDRDAAERHWERLSGLFGKALKSA